MTFAAALEALKAGKRITCDDEDEVQWGLCFPDDDSPLTVPYFYCIDDGDCFVTQFTAFAMLSDDWRVVE